MSATQKPKDRLNRKCARPGVVIYHAQDGWRWRYRAENYEIVAESGEAYVSQSNARRAWTGFLRDLAANYWPAITEAHAGLAPEGGR